ncbi:MAG: HAD family hydrolase [Desulfurococcaceae archaeon]
MTRCLAISFDIWGTLLDLNGTLRLIAESASTLYGLENNYVMKQVMRSLEEAKALRRTAINMDIKEVLERSREIMARNLGISRNQVTRVIEYTFETINNYDVVYPDVPTALSKLLEMNVYMGVIGNVLFWPSYYTRILLDRTGLSSYMKLVLFSDEIGYSKPDRGIFLEFSRRSGYPPGRVIHVGDNVVEDVGGALSAGFHALLINRNIKNRVFIQELKSGVISNFHDLLDIYSDLEKTVCRSN